MKGINTEKYLTLPIPYNIAGTVSSKISQEQEALFPTHYRSIYPS